MLTGSYAEIMTFETFSSLLLISGEFKPADKVKQDVQKTFIHHHRRQEQYVLPQVSGITDTFFGIRPEDVENIDKNYRCQSLLTDKISLLD